MTRHTVHQCEVLRFEVDEFGRVDLRMSQMRRWSSSTGKPVAPVIQDIQETQETRETREPKAMTKTGHAISIRHQITRFAWKRSSRSGDKDMVAVRRIK